MATANPFDLLGDNDNEDPSQLIAVQQQKIAPKKAPAPTQAASQRAKPAKLPTKPLPPAQAVREAKNDAGHGGGRGSGRGYGRGRGGGGFSRDSSNNDYAVGNAGFAVGQGTSNEHDNRNHSERRGGYGGRGSSHDGHRGGFSNEMGDGDRPRRVFEHRSGTGRGNETKREGAGRANWGTSNDEIAQVTQEVFNEGEKYMGVEKPSGEEDVTDVNKENPTNETEEKEPENKEMTLEEYEKVVEEKRKALQALKTKERKVDVDKELASMQQLSSKKDNDDIFIKLGSDKDKRKELSEKEEKTKKSVSINSFLKPAEGEYYGSSGRNRNRGPRSREAYSGGRPMNIIPAPKIEDPHQFPTLGA